MFWCWTAKLIYKKLIVLFILQVIQMIIVLFLNFGKCLTFLFGFVKWILWFLVVVKCTTTIAIFANTLLTFLYFFYFFSDLFVISSLTKYCIVCRNCFSLASFKFKIILIYPIILPLAANILLQFLVSLKSRMFKLQNRANGNKNLKKKYFRNI